MSSGVYHQHWHNPVGSSYPPHGAPTSTWGVQSHCFSWDDPDSKYRKGRKVLWSAVQVLAAVTAVISVGCVVLPSMTRIYHKHSATRPIVELFSSENCDKCTGISCFNGMYYLNFWNAYPEQDAHKIVISAESQHWWGYADRSGASFEGRRGFGFCDLSFQVGERADKTPVKSLRVHHGAAYLFGHCLGPKAPWVRNKDGKPSLHHRPLNIHSPLTQGWWGFSRCHRLDTATVLSAKFIEVRSTQLDQVTPGKKKGVIRWEDSSSAFS